MHSWRSMSPIFFVLALTFLPITVQAADDQPADAVPKGEVMQLTFEGSKIFPGTFRDYWTYVPRQYDPAKPACVYVNQDGIQYNAPAVFDQLIHSREMPVTIGVFVMHGRVKATSDEALDRFNRSYEYDGLGDSYARFLLDELLPAVETKTTSDGRPIRLSKAGNDRCIGGASSGAICAFTAAWERPDEFSRVFSSVGTYVGLRGGNEYATLVRKYEPKPIRIFLQDGSADLNIYAGDWWMANLEMERALTFAGYEVQHIWGEGGHNLEHATEVFPDAMRFLWKDWPAKVKVGAGSQQLQDILIPGEQWQLASGDHQSIHGLAANAKGEVFYSGVVAGAIYRIGLDGQVSTWLNEHSNGPGAFGPDGRLYVPVKDDKIVAYDEQVKPTEIQKGFAPYDLVIRHDRGIYVTSGSDTPQILYINPDGKKQIVDKKTNPQDEERLFDEEMGIPRSLALSPDQSLLYIADHHSRWVYSYQIQPDGELFYRQRYFHLHLPDTPESFGAGGMQTDRDGRLYVATTLGIQVCDQAGRVNCIIPIPAGGASDVCFGGANFDTLFVIGNDEHVYKRKVKTLGANSFQPPIQPPPPRL